MFGTIGSLVKGSLYGAGAMYFLDPDRGRRRRAGALAKAVGLTHELEGIWVRGCRDLTNRSIGVAAETRRLVANDRPEDGVLEARVRSALGHLVTDARTVEVDAYEGCVTLRGTVRPGELERLIPAVERIPGVDQVESGLTTAGVPVPPPQPSGALRPGTRLLMTAGGGLMMLTCVGRRGLASTAFGTAGFGLFVRGLVDRPGPHLGRDREGGGIDVRKAIHIAAPVEKVFDFVADYEQSGRFMPHVAGVKKLGDGMVRWTLEGPAGIGRLVCDERLIEQVENDRIVWRSAPDAPLSYVGECRFTPDGDGTRLEVRLAYHPPGGMFGYAAASFFGVDPKHLMDQSLNRIKQHLEAGSVAEASSEGRG